MANLNPGALIGASFGLVFILINAGELPSGIATTVRVLGLVAFLGLLGMLFAGGRPSGKTTPGPPDRPMFGRRFWLVVAVEVIVGWAGVLIINRVLDHPEAGVAWIALIVGLHFLALAVVWDQPSVRWLGMAITIAGAAGLLLAALGASDAVIATVAGIGAGTLLLGGSWWAVLDSLSTREQGTGNRE